MSAEMDAWLARQQTAPVCVVFPTPKPKNLPVPPCPLNLDELRWLYGRYERCSFPPASAFKRFAKHEFDRLTPRGHNLLCRFAYRFRRQVFQGDKRAVKWTESEFLAAVRKAAATPISK